MGNLSDNILQIRATESHTILYKNLQIPMRDSVHLACDVYLPDDELLKHNGWDRLPAVMEYIPYRKDEASFGKRFSENLAERGYAVVRVDCRGTGSSEGINIDEYSELEQQDGYDAVEWIAAQPWCDGQVNMMGISYGGFTALQIAAAQPEHLRSIIPIDFTDNRYTDDCMYSGGLLRMYYNIAMYGTQMVAYNAMPPSVFFTAEKMDEIWMEHLQHNDPYFLNWLLHPKNDAYWKNGSVSECVERIQCPCYLIGAWRDGYPNPPFRLFSKLNCPKKILMGPWNHSWPNKAIPGPRVDYLKEVQRWLDYWCKGIETGIMDEPPIDFFVQKYQKPDADRLESEGYWCSEWFVKPTQTYTLYLSQNSLLADQSKILDSTQSVSYIPQVGLNSGLWSGGIVFGLPGDHRNDEGLMTCFTSKTLTRDLLIFGRPEITLSLAKPYKSGSLSVFLTEVSEDGSSVLICRGIRNLCLNEAGEQLRQALTTITIPLDFTAWQFSAGNRIRISISQCDFPNFWPLPEQDKIDILCKGETLLNLPELKNDGDLFPRSFSPSETAVTFSGDTPDMPIWESTYDHLRDQLSVRIAYDSDFESNEGIHCFHSMDSTFRLPIHKPELCSAQGHCVCSQEREGGNITAESDVLMHSDKDFFHLVIHLRVQKMGEELFTKQWKSSFPRAGK